ncbi:MAG TPA: hypothetical protein VK724_04650 [Bryobacteraceae bacterium]|nr:hypothetical protein [Bryobacteraceae bacterium]
MTTLRKWRFPILIGSGLIAAGVLVYFSNAHIGSDKTQGAIGQRDVYRDGQVASADVATPGSAPVATTAILESSDFKALAKNPAFQELMRYDAFNGLMRHAELGVLLRDMNFRAAIQDVHFAELVNSASFQVALRTHQDLFVALKSDLAFKAFTNSHNMEAIFRSEAFRSAALDKSFDRLMNLEAFRSMTKNDAFDRMVSDASFARALESGSAAQAMARLHE